MALPSAGHKYGGGRIKAIETFWNDLVMMVQGMDGSKVRRYKRSGFHGVVVVTNYNIYNAVFRLFFSILASYLNDMPTDKELLIKDLMHNATVCIEKTAG